MKLFTRLLFSSLMLLLPGLAAATTTINHQFGPGTINQGDTSLYTITVSNDSNIALTNANVTVFLDNTILSPNVSGNRITIATGAVISNTCGFTGITAAATTTKIVLTGGTVPIGSVSTPTLCTFSIYVTSIVPGTYHAVIPANTVPSPTISGYVATEGVTSVQNGTSADITLQVNGLSAPTGTKSYSPSLAIAGDPTTLTIVLTNPNANATMPLTTFTDDLSVTGPAGMKVASLPGSSINCTGTGNVNGTFTPAANDTVLILTGGTIGQGGNCTLTVNVVVPTITGTSQTFTNTLAVGAIGNTRGLSSPTFNKALTVNTPITVTKSFGTTTISGGQPSLMTVTITNSSTVNTLPITSFIDNFSLVTLTILDLAHGGTTPTVVCDGTGSNNGTLTDSLGAALTNGSTSIKLASAIAGPKSGANGKCVITASVTSTVDGPHTNNIPADTVVNPNNYHSAAVSAILTANTQLTITKSVSPGSIAPGQWAAFTVTINNWSTGAANNITFKDILPSAGGQQMVVYNASGSGGADIKTTSAGCTGGSWYGTDLAGVSTGVAPVSGTDPGLLWSGGTIVAGAGAAPGVCTIKIYAQIPAGVANTLLTFGNSIPIGGASNGTIGNTVVSTTANLSEVYAVAVTKAFANPKSIAQGGQKLVTLTLRNRIITGSLTGINLTDNLPAGLTLAANPSAVNGCGGTLQANPLDTVVKLTGGSIAARTAAAVDRTCTITFFVTGVTIGIFTNTIRTTDFTSSGGTFQTDISDSLTVTPGITGTKTFSPTSVTSGGKSRVTITVTNASNGNLTNVSVNDNDFITGTTGSLTIANPANAASSCAGSPTLVANPGATSAQLFGAILTAGTSCNFSFDVITSGAGPWKNTIPIGGITSNEGVSNTIAVTASLTAAAAAININKSFNPVIVTGGVPSTLTLTLTNSSATVTMHNVGFTDVFPSGIQIYSVPSITNACSGGVVTAIPGDGKVSVAGVTMAPSASCNITLQVTSVKFLNLTNTIPAGAVFSDEGYTNPSLVSSTLSTLQGLGVMKAFYPANVSANNPTRLKIQLVSTFDPNAPSPLTLTGVSFTDTLTGVLVAAVPNATTTCAGTFTGGRAKVDTSNSGSNGIVTISLATIPPNTTCEIAVDVMAPGTLGTYTNTIPANAITSDQGIPNQMPASANLNVVASPTIGKAFSGTKQISVGGTNLLTVTITNGTAIPGAIPVTGVGLTDTLPPGLAIASPSAAATTCTQGSVIATPGTGTLSLSGANIPALGSCTFSANITGNTAGSYTNTIAIGQLVTNEGLSNPGAVSDTLKVLAPPTISKSFNPVHVATGVSSTLTLTLGNPNSSAITLSSALVDALPGGVVIAATPNIVNNCAGSVTANAGASSITYASAASSIPGSTPGPSGCTISVDVTSSTDGVYTNTIAAGQLSTSAGVNQNPAIANLSVGTSTLVPPTVSKVFSPSTIATNGTSTLTITLSNTNLSALTVTNAAGFVDTLPANVSVAATPNIGGTCPGAVTTGANTITYANGATIPAGGCTIKVDVTSATSGSYTNTIISGNLQTNGGNNAQPATAGLVVQAPTPPTVSKSFSPNTINPGATSTLTISLGNSNSSAITLSSDFIDTLPVAGNGKVTVAATPNLQKTCPGTVTANANATSILYPSGSVIPAGGCNIQVNVTASDNTGSPYTNTIAIGSLVTNAGSNGAAATAKLYINPPQPPSISKSFSPASIAVNGTSTLTLSFGNGNLSPMALTSDLVDTLPTNVKVATSPNIQVGSGCTLANVAAAAGGGTVTYKSGGVIPAGGCTVSVNVTSAVVNNYTNTINSAALVTNAGNNTAATSATLTVLNTPTIIKAFSPASITSGGTSTISFTLTNTNATALTGAGFTDTLGSMAISGAQSAAGTCTGAEKRAAYNQLGANWKSGQDFRPPPNWDEGFEFRGGSFTGGNAGDFSDFFEQLFGRTGYQSADTGRHYGEHLRGQDSHAKIHIDLEDSYRGATRNISLSTPEMNAQGQLQVKHRSLNVKIPKGIKPGQHIKLAGQGNPGVGSGQAGDLFLEIAFNNHPLYRVSETDVYLDLPVTPWEAALGAKIKVPTPEGSVDLKIPPNSRQGSKLRLAGRGLPAKTPGDFFVVLQIVLPPATTEHAKAVYQNMQQALDFNPRQSMGV